MEQSVNHQQMRSDHDPDAGAGDALWRCVWITEKRLCGHRLGYFKVE
jgi:hypothetical protein